MMRARLSTSKTGSIWPLPPVEGSAIVKKRAESQLTG